MSKWRVSLMAGVAVLCIFALFSNVDARQQVNILTRGTGGVGRLLLGVGQGGTTTASDALLFTGTTAPTSGTSGTAAGQAGPMSHYWDVANLRGYINTNTKASPTWTQAGDGVTGTLYAEVSITNAQFLAIRATPQTLVAAPGAGKVLEFISCMLFFDRTAVYSETADNLAVRYVDGSGVIVSQAIETTGFVDAATDASTNGLAKIDAITLTAQGDNKALVLHNTGDGEFGGGNAANVIRVKVAYRIHAAGW